MSIYLTTDTHLNHLRLLDFGRPEDFEKRIIKSLDILKDTDILIHLGDICIGKDYTCNKVFTNLKCKKILVRGNHDNKSIKWYYNVGWDFVCDKFELDIYGKIITFTHRPTREYRTINIHGHTHGNNHHLDEYFEFYGDKHIDISQELNNYRLYSLKKIIEKI